jgi:predicted metalloendopeptidase
MNRLIEFNWMENPTKNMTLKKLASMKQGIGYPKVSANLTAIAKAFRNIIVQENNFFGNKFRKGENGGSAFVEEIR